MPISLQSCLHVLKVEAVLKLEGDPYPHGPGRLPDRERLLGALLLGARYSAGRPDAERQDGLLVQRDKNML